MYTRVPISGSVPGGTGVAHCMFCPPSCKVNGLVIPDLPVLANSATQGATQPGPCFRTIMNSFTILRTNYVMTNIIGLRACKIRREESMILSLYHRMSIYNMCRVGGGGSTQYAHIRAYTLLTSLGREFSCE